jgi:hypothetical protein
VEAGYGIDLPDADAKRMVNRFSSRFNAELREDHITQEPQALHVEGNRQHL